MLLQKLLNAGLSEKEAKTYLAVLELGEASIAQISKKAAIKRSTVYEMLENLKERGLISKAHHKKRPIYLAENPNKLIGALEKQKKGLEEAMPELLSIMNLLEKKPRIRFFEGEVGIKETFEDMLDYPDQELIGWYSDDWTTFDEKFFYDYFTPKRLEKKISVRSIFPLNETTKKLQTLSQKHLRKSKFVTDSQFNISSEILLYGKNKIAIVAYAESLALIIESQVIFTSLKSIFEAMWNSLPEEKNYAREINQLDSESSLE